MSHRCYADAGWRSRTGPRTSPMETSRPFWVTTMAPSICRAAATRRMSGNTGRQSEASARATSDGQTVLPVPRRATASNIAVRRMLSSKARTVFCHGKQPGLFEKVRLLTPTQCCIGHTRQHGCAARHRAELSSIWRISCRALFQTPRQRLQPRACGTPRLVRGLPLTKCPT